jgi:two-component system sensor histidine kinase MprB
MSLRWKIAIAMALLSALATAVVGAVSFRTTEDRLVEEVDDSLRAAAEVLVVRWSERPLRRPRLVAGPIVIVPERIYGVDQYVVQVLGADGRVLDASEGVQLPVDEVDRELAAAEVGGVVRTAADLSDGTTYRVITVGTEGGAVQVARDLAETERVLDDLRVRTWWLVGLVALASALAGWLLAAGVTSRLRRLTAASEQVAATGDLRVDAPVAGDDEVGRLGRAFDHMLGSLAASREQQQRLVEDAGHELRTPLTSLRTNVDVLRRHSDLSPEVRAQVVADIERDTGELAALVEEVVALAADRRSDEQAVRLVLGELAAEVAERVRRRTGRAVQITTDGSTVVARPGAIERAISNLLDNAAKFDPSDTPLELEVARGRVTVRDRGPGIALSDLPHVFERFHRAPEARTLPGSGLGLSIVAEVAAAHGGTVFARNRDDGGAEVGFELPVA